MIESPFTVYLKIVDKIQRILLPINVQIAQKIVQQTREETKREMLKLNIIIGLDLLKLSFIWHMATGGLDKNWNNVATFIAERQVHDNLEFQCIW